jgi:hypothetical protein
MIGSPTSYIITDWKLIASQPEKRMSANTKAPDKPTNANEPGIAPTPPHGSPPDCDVMDTSASGIARPFVCFNLLCRFDLTLYYIQSSYNLPITTEHRTLMNQTTHSFKPYPSPSYNKMLNDGISSLFSSITGKALPQARMSRVRTSTRTTRTINTELQEVILYTSRQTLLILTAL